MTNFLIVTALAFSIDDKLHSTQKKFRQLLEMETMFELFEHYRWASHFSLLYKCKVNIHFVKNTPCIVDKLYASLSCIVITVISFTLFREREICEPFGWRGSLRRRRNTRSRRLRSTTRPPWTICYSRRGSRPVSSFPRRRRCTRPRRTRTSSILFKTFHSSAQQACRENTKKITLSRVATSCLGSHNPSDFDSFEPIIFLSKYWLSMLLV